MTGKLHVSFSCVDFRSRPNVGNFMVHDNYIAVVVAVV